jgi:peptidoglycan-associated lipoprotein
MKRCVFSGLGFVLLLSLGFTGCKKKTQPVAPPPVTGTGGGAAAGAGTGPSPTIDLTASPTTVQRGQESVLTWDSTHADSVVIDGGVGNVGPRGTIRVAPLESTTYTATATGSGGSTRASARVTVARGGLDEGDVIATDIQALQKAIEDGLIQPVFFNYDSAELSSEAKAVLEENARWFRRYPQADIVIEGHCDERGTEEYNLALGDRRAQAALNYLVQMGVAPSRVEAISYGEERPFVAGHTEAAWAKNRRAHFVVR